jgi:hypothetical protein
MLKNKTKKYPGLYIISYHVISKKKKTFGGKIKENKVPDFQLGI